VLVAPPLEYRTRPKEHFRELLQRKGRVLRMTFADKVLVEPMTSSCFNGLQMTGMSRVRTLARLGSTFVPATLTRYQGGS
jgi:hypothetical protein